MRGDVKRKTLPCSLLGEAVHLASSPISGASMLGASRIYLELAPASCGLCVVGFIFPMVVRRLRLVKLRKQGCWLQITFANHDPMRDSRPIALLGCARGHRIEMETSVLTDSTRRCLTGKSILTLDPERSENRKATSGQENLNNGLDLRLTLKRIRPGKTIFYVR
jgi:hypothetical protein